MYLYKYIYISCLIVNYCSRMINWHHELANRLFEGVNTSDKFSVLSVFTAALADTWLQFDNVRKSGTFAETRAVPLIPFKLIHKLGIVLYLLYRDCLK